MSCWAADPASNKLKYHYLPPEEVITIEVGKQQSEVLLKSWVGKKNSAQQPYYQILV